MHRVYIFGCWRQALKIEYLELMFPFTINYSRYLSCKLSDSELAESLENIKKLLEDKTAEDVRINNNELTFKSSFFGQRWNWNIMVTIDRGRISLVSDDGKTILKYKIFMYQLFVGTAIMSIFIGLVSGIIGIGVLCFAWLCGGNWIVAVIRHRGLIREIAKQLSNKSIKDTDA